MSVRAALLRARGLLAGDARGEEVLVVVGSVPGVTELSRPIPATRVELPPLQQAS